MTSGPPAGEAHSLQRLAEVRIAEGDSAAAMQLLQQALPLARASIVAKHLLQRDLRHDDPRRIGSARGSSDRRSRRVDARLGGRLSVLFDHAVRARRDRLRPGR